MMNNKTQWAINNAISRDFQHICLNSGAAAAAETREG